MVNGCFWHGHECHLFKWPATRPDFWREKISGNKERDLRNIKELDFLEWRVRVVWECDIKVKNNEELVLLLNSISGWIKGYNNDGCEDC